MMRHRSVRGIAIVLALVAACVAVLGWDLVYQRLITDTFLAQPQPSDDLTTH